MRQILIEIAYRGTFYHGWARQRNNVPTVQERLETALEKVFQRPTALFGSSRTDAGVHAFGQMAVFFLENPIPVEKLVRAVNFYLPEDIRVVRGQEIPLDFHPLEHVIKKRYVYAVDDGPVSSPFLKNLVWLWKNGELEVEKMDKAARFLIGTHDFAAFQSQGSPRLSTKRTVFQASVKRFSQDDFWGILNRPVVLIEIEGNGFLYHMVRIIAGTLVQVGSGRRSCDWVEDVLSTGDRSLAGPTAPPEGLYLTKITLESEKNRILRDVPDTTMQ